MVDHFKIFSYIAYFLNTSQNQEKFNKKRENFIFIGYINESKGYHLFNPNSKNQLEMSRDGIFNVFSR